MNNDALAIALDEFQQILTPDQTVQLKSYSHHAPTPDDVVSLTKQVIESNANRKSQILASRLQGLLISVQQYCNIIDTCVGPNQIAALVWGSIKLVILTSSNFAEYFEKLSERVAQLSNYCPRLLEYDKLFPTTPRLQQALSDLYAIVVSFCSKALHVIQEKGVKRFSKSIWKSFKVEFKEIEESISEAKNEVAEELALASEQEAQKFRGYLTAAVEENNSFRVEHRVEIEASKAFRSQQRNALQQSDARQIQKILKEEERQKIRLLRLIPSHDYNLSLRRARGLRSEGTCDWLLQRPEFLEWADQGNSKHLWCYGLPGCGKSILLGHVIDHLSRSVASHNNAVVIYYFFDHSVKKSLHVSAFLQCILHQVITVDSLLPGSQRSLESLFEGRISDSGPATDKLEQLFCHFLNKYKCAYLLIDGLDEASEVEQRNVKSFLKTIQGIDSVRIFAMSHVDMDITRILTQCSRLQIMSDDLERDIAVFVQSQIDIYSQDHLAGCSSSALDLIKQKLVSDAEGMFLWADLQLKAIVDTCEEDGTTDRIPDLLEALPRGIMEMYSLMLQRIMKQPNHQPERARKVFQWALYGRQPLSIEQLQEAVSITAGQKSWNAPAFELDASRLGKLCANLIDYDQVTKQVALAHHSVESFLRSEFDDEYLKAFTFDEIKTEQYLGDVCLTYLSFTDFHKALVRTSDMSNLNTMSYPARVIGGLTPGSIRPWLLKAASSRRPRTTNHSFDVVNALRIELSSHQSKRASSNPQLLEYCKTYWHTHSRYIDPKRDMQRFSHLQNFISQTYLPKEWMPWSSANDKISLPHWGMFVWAVDNGHKVIYCVWKNIVAMGIAGYWERFWREGGVAIFESACSTANLEQLEILLECRKRGINYAQPSKYELNTALVSVCHLGHGDVIERLLYEQADVNAATAGYEGKTALQAAAGGGHLAIIERLLQAKADVNAAAAARFEGRTALQAAAGGGYLTVVERLLQAKADVNAAAATGDGGRTALQAAAGGGHLAVVERLLQAKADVNAAVGNRGRTALQAAAGGGYLAVVERLLQAKADVNAAAAAGYEGRTALQAAAGGGHFAVVERLLQAKADVNAAVKERGKTALQTAAGGGHLAVVERLLQAKANVNAAAAAGYEGRTALQAAADGGHLAVVERLLQEKADVNAAAAAGYKGKTALQAAAGGGHLAVVERLLQAKADINEAVGDSGSTALQAAAGGGYLAVVERLLQEKADVNAAAAGDYGRTALQDAAGGGYLAVVERLLQAKADVNATAGEETALQSAAGGGHLAVVERLLQAKADVNAAATGDYGRTALQAAAGGGYLAIVERLLQAKANVNAAATGDYGRTALQAAAGGGYLTIVERLLQAKANVNAAATGDYGRTALQAAAGGGHLAVVERLLQAKADVNAAATGYEGRTALQAAAGGGHLAVVERLLQAKVDVNAVAGHRRRTALQAAVEGGHEAIVSLLRQAGAQ